MSSGLLADHDGLPVRRARMARSVTGAIVWGTCLRGRYVLAVKPPRSREWARLGLLAQSLKIIRPKIAASPSMATPRTTPSSTNEIGKSAGCSAEDRSARLNVGDL